MKVRIHSDNFQHSGFDNFKFGSEFHFDAGELDCLWLDDVLNNVPIDKVDDTFRDMIRLVKRGGSLIVNGTDIYEVSKALANYNIGVQDANNLLYANNKINCFTVSFVVETIKQYGLTIKTKRVSGYEYSVEAVR
jgi:ubiquinone/menaquinone biosynthesis C-methylase UbiE